MSCGDLRPRGNRGLRGGVRRVARADREDPGDNTEPGGSAEEFGQSWHREGDDFIQSFRKITVDLGHLADILDHIHDTMLDNVNEFQSVDLSEGGRYHGIRRSMPESG